MKRSKMLTKLGLEISKWRNKHKDKDITIKKIDELSNNILNMIEKEGMSPPTAQFHGFSSYGYCKDVVAMDRWEDENE